MLSISRNVAAAAVDAITAKIEVGAGTARIDIYDGAKPVAPDMTPSTQLLLLRVMLPANVFPPAVEVDGGAQSTAAAGLKGETLANGVASWFVIFSKDGVPIMTGDCSLPDGTGECKLQNLQIIAGRLIYIRSLIAFHPE